MRDIREDLRQRLTRIGIQRGELQARLTWLAAMQEHIEAAIEYEAAQSDNQTMLFSEHAGELDRGSSLARFIRDVLSDLRPRSLEELKISATSKGLNFNGKNPGRVLHFALVGMAQSNLVESLGNGVWRLKSGPITQQPELEIPELEIDDGATLM
jgi:hypothetical protein